ncbi:MAG: hypothetical protein NTW19_23035 [Planctomycetota bacterium]|nr:hypothetical protein [Planctomycetota bacterium]
MNPKPDDDVVDARLDAKLARFLRERPEPTPPADLATRAIARAAVAREAADAKALQLESWLARRRWFNRVAAGAAAAAVGAVLFLGAGPVAKQWTLVQQASLQNATGTTAVASGTASGESATTSADGGGAATDSSSSSSSEAAQIMLIVGGLVVVGLGATGVQRALGSSTLATTELYVPSLR